MADTNCQIHKEPVVSEPGGEDMPTIHGRTYCPSCQALFVEALDALDKTEN